jgi:hypothetical protein
VGRREGVLVGSLDQRDIRSIERTSFGSRDLNCTGLCMAGGQRGKGMNYFHLKGLEDCFSFVP